MVAVWLPVLALFASFAIDFGHFFDYSRNLQNRADAAAIAAGDGLGNICASNPTSATTAPSSPSARWVSYSAGPPAPRAISRMRTTDPAAPSRRSRLSTATRTCRT